MAKYKQIEAGEWVYPIMDGYKMSCCDCGLVHKIDFRVCEDEPDRIEFRATRDNRATAQVRRHNKNNSQGLTDKNNYK